MKGSTGAQLSVPYLQSLLSWAGYYLAFLTPIIRQQTMLRQSLANCFSTEKISEGTSALLVGMQASASGQQWPSNPTQAEPNQKLTSVAY